MSPTVPIPCIRCGRLVRCTQACMPPALSQARVWMLSLPCLNPAPSNTPCMVYAVQGVFYALSCPAHTIPCSKRTALFRSVLPRAALRVRVCVRVLVCASAACACLPCPALPCPTCVHVHVCVHVRVCACAWASFMFWATLSTLPDPTYLLSVPFYTTT